MPIHNTSMTQFISPAKCLLTVGAWVDTVSPTTALTYMKRRTAAAATNQLIIPIEPLQDGLVNPAIKGTLLTSIDIWWELTTAALTTLTALISKMTLPLDTIAIAAPSAPAFTYDALNLTNANRIAVEQRKMTLTLTTPFYIHSNELTFVDLTIVAPGTSVFDFYGARSNFTLRL